MLTREDSSSNRSNNHPKRENFAHVSTRIKFYRNAKKNGTLILLFFPSGTFKAYLKIIRLSGISIQLVINGVALRDLPNALHVI